MSIGRLAEGLTNQSEESARYIWLGFRRGVIGMIVTWIILAPLFSLLL